jgi:hypothetical protein
MDDNLANYVPIKFNLHPSFCRSTDVGFMATWEAAIQYRVHPADRLDHIKGDEECTETIGNGQTVEHQED